MPESIKRERALLDGELVTVLERKGRKATVRNAFGYVQEVSARDLVLLPDTDDRATFEVKSE